MSETSHTPAPEDQSATVSITLKGRLLCQSCKDRSALPPHTCPYREDINDDHKTKCNCCADCQHECAQTI